MNRALAVELPSRMQSLDRDARGFPIPFVVFRDSDGTPHFTINDHRKVILCIADDRCAICGQTLLRGRWFIGGPQSAFHEHGAYIDPPIHRECAEYALQTCPYLAARSYSKRIDLKTLDRSKAPDSMIFVDPTLDPARPETFVAVMSSDATRTAEGYFRPRRPYINVTYWRKGQQVEGL
jgi:hypothetical protein